MSNMTKFIGGSAVFGQRVSNVETAVDALIGIPMPWAGATPPTNHLLLNGASFNKAAYPKLAAVYPSGVLPDLRGEFIRGWDNAKGADPSRSLLSWQDATGITDWHGDGGAPKPPRNYYTCADRVVSAGAGFTAFGDSNPAFNISGITSYIFTRPRNVAFNYIVRAA